MVILAFGSKLLVLPARVPTNTILLLYYNNNPSTSTIRLHGGTVARPTRLGHRFDSQQCPINGDFSPRSYWSPVPAERQFINSKRVLSHTPLGARVCLISCTFSVPARKRCVSFAIFESWNFPYLFDVVLPLLRNSPETFQRASQGSSSDWISWTIAALL